MINLLPPDVKESYRYARYNVSLRHWVVACSAALVVSLLIGSYGWLSVRHAIVNNDRQSAVIQTNLDKAQLTKTNQKITDISNSFKLVEQVLGQEIIFSQLLKQMATALPTDTYLSGLDIAGVTSGSGLDVTVNAASYQSATQVQLNLADPKNQIFAKADIENITCDSTSATDPKHPCKITLRAQFAQNNPFLFINQQQVKL